MNVSPALTSILLIIKSPLPAPPPPVPPPPLPPDSPVPTLSGLSLLLLVLPRLPERAISNDRLLSKPNKSAVCEGVGYS